MLAKRHSVPTCTDFDCFREHSTFSGVVTETLVYLQEKKLENKGNTFNENFLNDVRAPQEQNLRFHDVFYRQPRIELSHPRVSRLLSAGLSLLSSSVRAIHNFMIKLLLTLCHEAPSSQFVHTAIIFCTFPQAENPAHKTAKASSPASWRARLTTKETHSIHCSHRLNKLQ